MIHEITMNSDHIQHPKLLIWELTAPEQATSKLCELLTSASVYPHFPVAVWLSDHHSGWLLLLQDLPIVFIVKLFSSWTYMQHLPLDFKQPTNNKSWIEFVSDNVLSAWRITCSVIVGLCTHRSAQCNQVREIPCRERIFTKPSDQFAYLF